MMDVWFRVLFRLWQVGECSMTDLAKSLDVTHKSVCDAVPFLESNGLVHSVVVGRKRLVSLSQRGKVFMDSPIHSMFEVSDGLRDAVRSG